MGSDTKTDIAIIMQRIDGFVRDESKRPYYGWHEDQKPSSETHRGPRDYYPVIQQIRSEFEEFLESVIEMKLGGTAVQIGLGIGGGSHFALRQVFERVVTVDVDPANIARFKAFMDLDPQRDVIIQGNSIDPAVIHEVFSVAKGSDLLFIDGGHLFSEVASDWLNFRDVVRSGGLICFHDHVPRPARYHELQIDIFLTWLEHQPIRPARIERLGTTLGIAYYVAP